MFLVSDDPGAREQRIRGFLTKQDCAIAVLLSAAHFEWIVSRAILALGKTPTRELRIAMAKCHGLDRYKEYWVDEVVPGRDIKRLPAVVGAWDRFSKAFELRHKLIHGRESCSLDYARPRVEVILKAADDVMAACKSEGKNLYARLAIRRNVRATVADRPSRRTPKSQSRTPRTR